MAAGDGSLKRAVFLCLLAGVLGAAGCDLPSGPAGGPAYGGGEGPGHRSQRLALRPDQELRLGRQAYKEVLDNPREYGRVVPPDDEREVRVRRVTQRIINAAGIEPLQREINLRRGFHFEWEVNVFDKGIVNAFCLPGGKIAVFDGILHVVGNNDDQLATVLSHEIAHALAHHSSERLATERSARGILAIFRNKAYDRAQEAEADKIGVFLMTFAGYDPAEAIRFWQRMARLESRQQQVPEFLSDHPSTEHRVEAMQDYVRRARAGKEAYDRGWIAPAR